MLRLEISTGLMWNEITEEFEEMDDSVVLELEHSLVSISKWESKYKKPFMVDKEKTREEFLYYIKCMTLNEVDDKVYNFITNDDIIKISKYIGETMTATTFSEIGPKTTKKDIITSEIIYYWMITMGIPVEFQYWHIDRLLTLIKVCDIKNSPPKKRSKGETLRNYARLNAERKKRLGTSG